MFVASILCLDITCINDKLKYQGTIDYRESN